MSQTAKPAGRVLYGLHPVREALKAGRVQSLFIVDGGAATNPGLKELVETAKRLKLNPSFSAAEALDALVGGALHQGVVALSGEYPYSSVSAILAAAEAQGVPPLVLVLDSVQDPQNLGALVRTADVMGVHGVIIPKDRAVAVTGTAVKASAGATEHMRIAQVTNVSRALDELKTAGLWVVGAVAEGGTAPWSLDLNGPCALVLGAEGKGIRPLVLRSCDLQAQIPMLGQVSSLNVSAAGSMLLYEIARQRAN